ncbi:Fasciclin-like arabinogalactan protein [Musa troglodytarum]|uniref:Fasciclin-like arabinogalactan protein n=1 Tax=Musa troglodytarum TaxID=320322 RepID=A0A9E7FCB3_9LILI|nr:Fasciclin-like arabinogalactan protein [Musa troglodytarum]
MGLTAIFCASTLLALLISSSTTAQSPPAPFLPPSPAPPHIVNLTDLLSVAGPFSTFLNYLLQTEVIDTFQNQVNNSKQGITIFVPKDSAFAALEKSDLGNLTQNQLRTLMLYHAFPKFYSLSQFKNLSNSNPVSTFAGGQYTLNVTDTSGLIRVVSNWATSKISSSVWSTAPVAVYQIDKVLLPLAIFSTDPPLAPAPAPAPEAKKPSDLSPTQSGIASAPKSSESSTTNGSSYGTSICLFNYLVLVLSGVLMLIM